MNYGIIVSLQFLLIIVTYLAPIGIYIALGVQLVILTLGWLLFNYNRKKINELITLVIAHFHNDGSLDILIKEINLKFKTKINSVNQPNGKTLTLLEAEKKVYLEASSQWEEEILKTINQIYPFALSLKQTKNQLENAAKLSALGEIAAGIAHEINNPLAIVHGKTQMIDFQIQEAMENKEPINLTELLVHTKDIEDTVNRMDKIVNSLRYFVREDIRNPMETALISELLDNVQVLSIDKCKKQGVKVFIENHLNPNDSLYCKPSQISQVLINLVNNSFDAVVHLPEKWIKLSCFMENNYVVFKVQDSGQGLVPEIKENILKNFYTNKITTKSSGTGIGLSIVKRIVDQHYGNIFLDTQESNTTFVVKIPRSYNEKNSSN